MTKPEDVAVPSPVPPYLAKTRGFIFLGSVTLSQEFPRLILNFGSEFSGESKLVRILSIGCSGLLASCLSLKLCWTRYKKNDISY